MNLSAFIKKSLERKAFWSGFISLVLLMAGIVYFEASIMKKRFFEEQAANHNPQKTSGAKPDYFWGRLQSSPAKGYVEFKDLSGGIVRFPSFPDAIPEKSLIILQGHLNDDRSMHIDKKDIHSNILWKFGVSALALGFLFLKIIQTLRFSKGGLRLTLRRKD